MNNGLYAALNYPITNRFTAIVTTGFSRYSLYSPDAEDAYSALLGTAGFNYRTGRQFSLDVMAQGLHNKYYNDDLRLLARANYWFFTKF